MINYDEKKRSIVLGFLNAIENELDKGHRYVYNTWLYAFSSHFNYNISINSQKENNDTRYTVKMELTFTITEKEIFDIVKETGEYEDYIKAKLLPLVEDEKRKAKDYRHRKIMQIKELRKKKSGDLFYSINPYSTTVEKRL